MAVLSFSPALAPSLADDAEVKNLVRQLGADTFQERQQAERQLMALSRSVLDDLCSALSGTDDPEILMRLKRIVEHNEA